MSKVESMFAVVGDRSDIVSALAHPPRFELTVEEIEDRIVAPIFGSCFGLTMATKTDPLSSLDLARPRLG